MSTPDKNRRKSKFGLRKSQILETLKKRDMKTIASWAEDDSAVYRSLISILFDPNELIRWRAIEAMGIVSSRQTGDKLSTVKQILRRLLWMMNDESGNLCWHAPEAIGEILTNVPQLIDEYGLVLASFVSEEPFERGVRLAIARAAKHKRLPFNPVAAKIAATLDDENPEMRAASVLALKALGDITFSPQVSRLEDDNSEVTLYDFNTGKLENVTVSNLVKG